jgi:endonuclease/exonuclease/phosphatase family metal-dependent hydrolase
MRRLSGILLLAAVLAAVLAGPAGATEIKVATWNLEWLTLRPAGDRALPQDVIPRQPGDFAALRRYADVLAADVVAFQEVDGPAAAEAVFPPAGYALHLTGDRVVQRVGFAVRRGLAFTVNPDLTALESPSGQLRSGADITLTWPGGRLRLLAVHLKEGCREARLTDTERPACPVLLGQQEALMGWVAARQAEGVSFVVLGDFNRWMDGRDAFYAGLARTAPLSRATEGHFSPCWGGEGFIDHIIAGGAARAWLRPATLAVLVYRESRPEWRERLSDHCPVSVRFALPD